MTTHDSTLDGKRAAALKLLAKQRSHVLFVLSNPKAGHESTFREWYRGAYARHVREHPNVLNVQHYEQHEVDVTRGRYSRLPFHYLGVYELSLDGAEQAAAVIERVAALHGQQAAAEEAATWLYYAAAERVGRTPTAQPCALTIAFANGVPGQESEFREWYATRHIRHAMNIPALASGQCFERTQFQRPGAMQAKFATIAIYEQDDTVEAVLAGLVALPPGTLPFPMLDLSRFTECAYVPV
jgi:hypothetical protein